MKYVTKQPKPNPKPSKDNLSLTSAAKVFYANGQEARPGDLVQGRERGNFGPMGAIFQARVLDVCPEGVPRAAHSGVNLLVARVADKGPRTRETFCLEKSSVPEQSGLLTLISRAEP